MLEVILNFEQSLKIAREQDYKRGIVQSLYYLGIVARNQKSYAEAEQCLKECLKIAEKFGDLHLVRLTHAKLGRLQQHFRRFQRNDSRISTGSTE